MNLKDQQTPFHIDFLAYLGDNGEETGTVRGHLSEHPIRDIIQLFSKIANGIFGTINDKLIDTIEAGGEAFIQLCYGAKHNRILYQKLIQGIPELLTMTPNKHPVFYRARYSLKSDNCIEKFEVVPFEGSVISKSLNIDKAFFTKKTDDYFNDKYGQPSSAIVQMKRSLIKVTKPVSSFVLGYFHEKLRHGKLHEGDIKIHCCPRKSLRN